MSKLSPKNEQTMASEVEKFKLIFEHSKHAGSIELVELYYILKFGVIWTSGTVKRS